MIKYGMTSMKIDYRKRRKAARKYKEWWLTHINTIEESHITNDGMVVKIVIWKP